MPAYDYRCASCGAEMEITHGMSESASSHPHEKPNTGDACDGALERLISRVGVAREVGHKAPTDRQIARAGFTKYVRGAKGYEKASGPLGSPDFIRREPVD